MKRINVINLFFVRTFLLQIMLFICSSMDEQNINVNGKLNYLKYADAIVLIVKSATKL